MTNISKITPPNCSHRDAICPSCGKIIGADADLCPYCRMFFLEEDINDIKDSERLVCRKCGGKKIHIFVGKNKIICTCLLCHSNSIEAAYTSIVEHENISLEDWRERYSPPKKGVVDIIEFVLGAIALLIYILLNSWPLILLLYFLW